MLYRIRDKNNPFLLSNFTSQNGENKCCDTCLVENNITLAHQNTHMDNLLVEMADIFFATHGKSELSDPHECGKVICVME